MNILLTGGTGFIGKRLGVKLTQEGHRVYVLSRQENVELPFSATIVNWEKLEEGISSGNLSVDAVINLAGQNIAQRWTDSLKKEITDSRVETTRRLVNLFRGKNLKTLISASAIGIYGDRGDEELTEESKPGVGFLSDVCKLWEEEAHKAQEYTRVVILRFGLVLGAGGGALAKMAMPFKLGFGGALGDGKMWVSWIHIDDLIDIICKALLDTRAGVYNAVAPNPVRNKEFSEKLAQRFGKKLFMPIPVTALKVLMGETAEVLLSSQKVFPKRLEGQDFKFKYPTVEGALQEVWPKS